MILNGIDKDCRNTTIVILEYMLYSGVTPEYLKVAILL